MTIPTKEEVEQLKRDIVFEIEVRSLRDEVEWVCERIHELEAENVRLKAGLNNFAIIVSNSSGIDGWHLNGDLATWDECLDDDTLCLLERVERP